jgi:hypothetical protein
MAERAREEVYGALADITSLFQGRMQLEPRGTVAHEGRSAWRFRVSLAAAPDGKAEDKASAAKVLPPEALPKGAASDESTQRRLSFLTRKEPKALTGEIWVDADTAVVLKAKLEGTLRVPPGPVAAKEAVVKVSLDSLLSDIGKVGPQAVPEHFLPDADKPSGIAEALERFGIRARDAGTSAEPEDDST